MADVGQLVRTIPWKEITLGEKLGEGGFGIVYRGNWKHVREEVAIKKIKGEIGADAEAELKREAEITKRLDSPYIIRLWGLCWEKQNYSMVMELMPKASLYHLLHAGQQLPWNVRYSIAQDIAYGLRLLHENKILHRDLKSLNVLLDSNLRAKLADFGLAKVKTQSRTTSKDSGGSVGTLAWMAPELFEGESCTEKTDLYAYGMTAWELASQETPFSQVANPHIIPVLVGKNKRPEIPADCPQGFTTLIQKCWSQEPSERPNLDYVVNVLEQITSSAPPAPAPAPLYQDGSLDSLSVVTNARPQPQDAELLKQMAQLRLDKQKAEQEKQALEQKLAQQQKAEQERLAREKAEQARACLEQERKKAQERQAQQREEATRAAAAAKPVAPPQERKVAPVAQATLSRITPAEVSAFLKQVASGLQDEAEASLRRNPALALATGDVTDHANRTFTNITGFQYAAWALDWHMWRMLQRYIPIEEQRLQAKQFATGAWVRQHGTNAEQLIQTLIKELQTYASDMQRCNYDKSSQQWIEKVGGAQRNCPIHVLQEYCYPKRPFAPCPSFKEDTFPRKLDVDISKVSIDFAIYRMEGDHVGKCCVIKFMDGVMREDILDENPNVVKSDMVAVSALLETRISQQRELVAELTRSFLDIARPAAPLLPPRPMVPQAQAANVKPRPVSPMPEAERKYPPAAAPQLQPAAAAPRIAPAEVSAFLKQIAAGQQDEAEVSLRRKASLAQASGDVTDHANRTFRNITGFQYALWALDWHMWKMILKYLPQDSAKSQLEQSLQAAWTKEHNQNAETLLQTLIQELKTYIYMPWDYDKCVAQWTKKVGGAQRNCPIHVLQEYCHPNRSFLPTPTFKEEEFPRKLDVDISKCGVDFGVMRYEFTSPSVMREGPGAFVGTGAQADHDSVEQLLSTRTEQFKELAASLGARQIVRPRP